jgi:hypothetical protein
MIASYCGEYEPYLLVSEHRMDVFRPSLRCVRDESSFVQSMRPYLDPESQRLQRRNATFEAMWETASAAPGRAYDSDIVPFTQLLRFSSHALLTLRRRLTNDMDPPLAAWQCQNGRC